MIVCKDIALSILEILTLHKYHKTFIAKQSCLTVVQKLSYLKILAKWALAGYPSSRAKDINLLKQRLGRTYKINGTFKQCLIESSHSEPTSYTACFS